MGTAPNCPPQGQALQPAASARRSVMGAEAELAAKLKLSHPPHSGMHTRPVILVGVLVLLAGSDEERNATVSDSGSADGTASAE